jgi:hypothetical protein
MNFLSNQSTRTIGFQFWLKELSGQRQKISHPHISIVKFQTRPYQNLKFQI